MVMHIAYTLINFFNWYACNFLDDNISNNDSNLSVWIQAFSLCPNLKLNMRLVLFKHLGGKVELHLK